MMAELPEYFVFKVSGSKDSISIEPVNADVKPVVHGHWIPHYDDGGGEYGADCSVCGVWSVLLDSADYYCPYCGARMDEKE